MSPFSEFTLKMWTASFINVCIPACHNTMSLLKMKEKYLKFSRLMLKPLQLRALMTYKFCVQRNCDSVFNFIFDIFLRIMLILM